MTDRNFRSAFLGKVGIKGVEERKSLELLLKEEFLDISRLEQFCLRFVVPTAYRIYLWKVLLGQYSSIITQFFVCLQLQPKSFGEKFMGPRNVFL